MPEVPPFDKSIFLANIAVPALPGLQYICEILGELFKPKHNACSLPPPPMTRTLLSPISSGRGIQFIIYFAQFISLFRQMLSAFMARATYANSQRCCIGFGNSFTKHHDSMAIFAGIFGQYICHDVGKWLPKTGYGPWPIDGGKNWKDGNRILGDGKTWNGLIGGSITSGILCAIIVAFMGDVPDESTVGAVFLLTH